MKKLLIIPFLVLTLNAGMTWEEFKTSFTEEVSTKYHKAKDYVSKKYEENKQQDEKHVIVDTSQDIVIDSGKAFWGLTKEAYYTLKIQMLEKEIATYRQKLKDLDDK